MDSRLRVHRQRDPSCRSDRSVSVANARAYSVALRGSWPPLPRAPSAARSAATVVVVAGGAGVEVVVLAAGFRRLGGRPPRSRWRAAALRHRVEQYLALACPLVTDSAHPGPWQVRSVVGVMVTGAACPSVGLL